MPATNYHAGLIDSPTKLFFLLKLDEHLLAEA